jgi:uncharacterized radical SAM protein YgiQ
MYLPATKEELEQLEWEKPDIILVTGDVYIDSPNIGIAVIGKVLINAGFRVGIISQPDVNNDEITKLGEPELFWGVSAGCMDSMVSNYTATGKKRQKDDLTAGGVNNLRPDRACIAYSNLIKKYFKNTKPIVLGGLEASLRRIVHYDFWNNKLRRSVLFDAKADILVYGMGEKSILKIAQQIKNNKPLINIRGICYISREPVDKYIELPSFPELQSNKNLFNNMFKTFQENTDPITAKGLIQKQDTRYLVQNPPQYNLTQDELDAVYNIGFERDAHPYYKKQGVIKALDTIRFSVTSHRGCFGQCNFCAISAHQGRAVISRSYKSILKEIKDIAELPGFKGNILNVGGPTANMYASFCKKMLTNGACKNKRCLSPGKCQSLNIEHKKQIELLKTLRQIKGIKKVFIGSGIRYDLILTDNEYGSRYLQEIVNHHISGQLKIAPEHTDENILKLMGKPEIGNLKKFVDDFNKANKRSGKKQFLTYYFIAAHPGCNNMHMNKLKSYIKNNLKLNPEQVQIFTPTPSTYSSLMYFLEINPDTGEKLFVEKNVRNKEKQKEIIVKLNPNVNNAYLINFSQRKR